jgi:glycosyltransferase involved in cell wall biosynthesis
VTDFRHKIGGIETYIYDVATLLAQWGHDVEIVWWQWGTTRSSRMWSMILSVYNIFFARKLQKKIDTFQPDVIRCHSVLRYIGRMGLKTINKSKAKKWIMYHDLWYFHPFPHTLTHETDLPGSFSWKDFSHDIHRPLIKFFALGKWILLKLLWKELKKFDIHLVPSDFMVNSVVCTVNKPTIVWPHFIQE